MPWRQVGQTGSNTANALGRVRAGLRLSTVADLGRALVRSAFSLRSVVSQTSRVQPALRLRAVAENRAVVRTGIRIGTALDAGRARINAALNLASRGDLLATVRPALRVTTSVAGTALATPRPGLTLRSAMADTLPARPAFRITQDRVILNGVYGSNSVTQEANPRTDWVNINNASGRKDGVFSTLTGDALAARSGTLRLAYADLVDKSSLTINEVKVDVYARMTGAVLSNATVIFEYSRDNGSTWFAVPGLGGTNNVGNFDTSVNGYAPIITNNVNTWAHLNGFTTRVRVSLDVGENYVVSVDAIHLVVNGERIVSI